MIPRGRKKKRHLVSEDRRRFVCGAPRNKGTRPTTNPADPDGVCDYCKSDRMDPRFGGGPGIPRTTAARGSRRPASGSVKTIVQSAMNGWLEKTSRLEVTAAIEQSAGYLNVRAKAGEAPLMNLNLEGLSARAVGAALRAVANALDP